MHRITFALISILTAIPAFGNARLPVVNVGAGSVSARAAFGEGITRPVATVATAPTPATNTPVAKKRVVARAAKKQVTPVAPTATPKVTSENVDTGPQIFASDVLSPRRPSADLWARSVDAPLRMPSPDEFTVIRSNAPLPEESLNVAPRAERVADINTPAVSQIDAQIARLNELQRRADENVRATVATTSRNDTTPQVASIVRAPMNDIKTIANDDAPVKISKMVVPMDDAVIERVVKRNESPRIAAVRDDMTKMNPNELRRAFRKTFLSENKHLSTFQIDSAFDVASDMSTTTGEFVSRRDLSEGGGIRPLEIKIRFRNDDSALSRDNYNLLTEYAGIILSNPTRAVQISIPQSVTRTSDGRKLAARRLAIVEQVLRDTGVSEYRIMPVLAERDDETFMLRMISNEQYETLTQQKRNMFGDTVGGKTYKSLSW